MSDKWHKPPAGAAAPRHPPKRWTGVLHLMACLAVGSCCLGCGSSNRARDLTGAAASHRAPLASSTRGVASKPRVNDAQDGDDSPTFPAYNLESNDDREVTLYGHAGDRSTSSAAASLVKRFFAAAQSGRGSAVCDLFDSQILKVVPQMGKASNPAYLRGNTCTEVMSKLLLHNHARLAREAATVTIRGVRSGNGKVMALLAFESTPERRYLLMQHERGRLKLAELLDGPFP